MANTTDLIVAAEQLAKKDEEALALEIGLRSKLIESDPNAADNPDLAVAYDTHMGLIDDLKALGWRILARWNKQLYGVVCGSEAEDEATRKPVLDSLNLGEAAMIAAVATALLSLGAPAAIVAPIAPLVVKKFIVPAKEELCVAWGEAIAAHG